MEFPIFCLKNFNFVPEFINWVKVLYTNVESCVSNNGYLSSSFMLHRLFRQGCLLSSILFLPVVEIVAILIRNSINIKGFNVKEIEIKLCQLADDTTLFFTDNNYFVKLALELFDEFYRYAGLKINNRMTKAIIILNDGSIKQDVSLGIKLTDGYFKTLGIWYASFESET